MLSAFRCLLVIVAVLAVPVGGLAQTHKTEVISETKSAQPWTKAPAGFQGVAFGSTIAEAENVLGKLKCEDFQKPGGPGGRRCTAADSRKAFRAKGQVVAVDYFFHEGQFVGVELYDSSTSPQLLSGRPLYSMLADVFERQFGPPTSRRTLRNTGTRLAGRPSPLGVPQVGSVDTVPFDYETSALVWENEQVYIYLESARNRRLSGGLVETQAWRHLKQAR